MKQLRQYEMLREIGRGGMASVHEARHIDLGRHVAIKVMLPHVAAEAQSVARFVREAKAACTVRHPHIVEIFDFGTADGVPFLVMELLEGETLKSRLALGKPLTVEDAVALLLPIAAAVAHAHDCGIVHRDLKPANVFLTKGIGGIPWPKVLDFGISKRTDSASHASWREGITGADAIIGTLAYMAPEQIRDASSATAASDQYALAVMLYELLTARLPSYGPSPYQLMHNILNAPIAAPSAFNAAIPRELDELIARALDRDPLKRFASVHAFASLLLGFAGRDACAIWKAGLGAGSSAAGTTLDELRSRVSGEEFVVSTAQAPRPSGSFWIQGAAVAVGIALLVFAVLQSGRPPPPPEERTSPAAPELAELPPVVAVDSHSAVAPVAAVSAPAPDQAMVPIVPQSHPRKLDEHRAANVSQKDPPASSAPPPREVKSKRFVEGTNDAPILE